MGTRRIFLIINLVTFLVYGWDKYLAKRNRYRIAEVILLGCALLGGNVGALLGMYIFRHKVSKTSFKLKLFAIIFLQVMIFILLKNYVSFGSKE